LTEAGYLPPAMLIEHEGKSPRVAASAYVAPNAVVSGDVALDEDCRVLFGAVLTADGGAVETGARCVVMEQAVIRGRRGHPVRLGDNVLIGPHAHVNGAQVEENAFVATGASLFPGARVGARAEVRIGAVVHVNSKVPADATVPIGWVVVGEMMFPPERHDEIWAIQRELDFPGTVFGLERPAEGETLMPEAMARYAEWLGRHRGDWVVG
jgi:carbonic anhydrase/acetyltransferase-like protein (isoleucine patch superfamily)